MAIKQEVSLFRVILAGGFLGGSIGIIGGSVIGFLAGFCAIRGENLELRAENFQLKENLAESGYDTVN